MVNFDLLPKIIKFNGNHYSIHVHVTAWGKLCVCYQLEAQSTIENSMFYTIYSQVVEPKMSGDIKYYSHSEDIIDVPTFEMAVNVLSTRVNTAIANGEIEVIH